MNCAQFPSSVFLITSASSQLKELTKFSDGLPMARNNWVHTILFATQVKNYFHQKYKMVLFFGLKCYEMNCLKMLPLLNPRPFVEQHWSFWQKANCKASDVPALSSQLVLISSSTIWPEIIDKICNSALQRKKNPFCKINTSRRATEFKQIVAAYPIFNLAIQIVTICEHDCHPFSSPIISVKRSMVWEC